MFQIVRSFSLAVLFTLAWTCAGYAQSVPITGGEYDDGTTWVGTIGGAYGMNQRETCDPDVMEVIEAQAWEAAQREVTQNANIYVRPDSVLSMTCFDRWISNQNRYAENNFPVDPDESEGWLLGGLMTDIMIVLIDDILTGIDPMLTDGYVQYGMLELLVIDQLEDVGSILAYIQDLPGLILCGGDKERYIEDSFPDLMLGDRAKNQGATPAYSSIGSGLSDSVGTSGYNCSRMRTVWQRAKCYDFATEEDDFYNATGVAYTGWDHDGFYTYEDYVATAASGRDYRLEPDMCDPPDDDLVDFPSIGDVLCWTQIHGGPALPALTSLLGSITLMPPSIPTDFPDGSPEWDDMHDQANPDAGTAGAGDVYQHYLTQVSGSFACSAPIRTGFIVQRNNSQYHDAVCPNPGCYFTAPTSMALTGTCSN